MNSVNFTKTFGWRKCFFLHCSIVFFFLSVAISRIEVNAVWRCNFVCEWVRLTLNRTLMNGIYYLHSITNELFLFREMPEILKSFGKHWINYPFEIKCFDSVVCLSIAIQRNTMWLIHIPASMIDVTILTNFKGVADLNQNSLQKSYSQLTKCQDIRKR